MILTNLEYFYLGVPGCRALVVTSETAAAPDQRETSKQAAILGKKRAEKQKQRRFPESRREIPQDTNHCHFCCGTLTGPSSLSLLLRNVDAVRKY